MVENQSALLVFGIHMSSLFFPTPPQGHSVLRLVTASIARTLFSAQYSSPSGMHLNPACRIRVMAGFLKAANARALFLERVRQRSSSGLLKEIKQTAV
jgi:hypothetical protein